MKRLGKNQEGILDSLIRQGSYPGTGWHWGYHSTAVRLLNSLVKRGYAAMETGKGRLVGTLYQPGRNYWRVTDAGRAYKAGREYARSER